MADQTLASMTAAAALTGAEIFYCVQSAADTKVTASQLKTWAATTVRVTSAFNVTSSTTLVNVTGLSISLAAGRSYLFEAYLSCSDAAAGGVKAAIAGTATATAIVYDGWLHDTNAIKGQAHATALAATVASSTTTATTGLVIRIMGLITVNAAGTLTVQFAQNTSSSTASTVGVGSWFRVIDTP